VVETLRQTGIEPLGDIPWGAHLCVFYEGADDLLDAVVPYLSAGARSNERCVWAIGDEVAAAEANAALGRAIPDLDRRLADGSIEILGEREWYLPDDRVDFNQIIRGWHVKLAEALEQGFEGLRVSGNAFWMETEYREEFGEYERELGRSLAGRPMLVLCTYAASLSRATDVLDVTRAHEFTLARRQGTWEVIETAELISAKQELVRLKADLEDRVRLRTRELADANAQLKAENIERERAEAALSEAQAELARAARLTSLGVLAGSIGHEVNQPLTAILTNSEASIRLLAAEPPNVAEAGAALSQIARDARRAADVIKRLRSLVAGTAEHADVDVNDAIREVVALMRAPLQARAVAIRLALDPGSPHLLGDRLQIQQAIMNLVSNAAEALNETSGAREVTIRSAVDADGAVVLTVEDRGPGIDPEVADRLFDPFFTTKAGGMGMGLSIVRSVAEAHGGTVSVSPGQAAGAVFRLTIPDQGAAP
jgi:C4-dicarboxylate-specific signal transduction histidine kinase